MANPKDIWQHLHSDIERYEKWSLIIKLTTISSVLIAFGLSINVFVVVIFILIFWLQDAIWKTYQVRLSDHIIYVEKQTVDAQVYSLYTNFESNRPGSKSILAEYLKSALRPTVAFPYLILVFFIIVRLLFI